MNIIELADKLLDIYYEHGNLPVCWSVADEDGNTDLPYPGLETPVDVAAYDNSGNCKSYKPRTWVGMV